ncbi:MAG: 16S rRNA (guanine(527)-N(7))-methyltransferase RsmG [Clostridia bacterium]|nr:16S rRNA (guanine(527)-N(7))-methyltransferase RsmG [Clostridia bacterium]
MKKLLTTTFHKYGIELSEKQAEQFEQYYTYLVEENEKFNLTAITEKNDVVIKHFIDSVLPFHDIPQNASVIDVGTGAGFPGVPLKIVRPDIHVTLLDSLNKRVEFLKRLCERLGLEEVTFVHARAEDYCKEKREKFDIAISRAVAALPTLAEYLLPFVRKGGNALMYKAEKADEEIKAGEKAIKTLGGRVEKVKNYLLEEVDGTRNVVFIAKITPTPSKYPRPKNLPKTKPIV